MSPIYSKPGTDNIINVSDQSKTTAALEIGTSQASSGPERSAVTLFTASLLCMMLFESINPPESYIYQFLSNGKHLPKHDIHRYVIPFFTYGQLIGFLPLTLHSELLGKCRQVIGIGLSLRIGSSLIHLLGHSTLLLPHQIARSMFGLASASKVAIKAHAYAHLPRHVFVTITGYMRAVNLIARVMGAALGFVFYRNSLDWSVAYSVQIGCLSIAIVAFIGNNIVASTPSVGTKVSKGAGRTRSFREFVRTLLQTYRADRFLTVITIWVIVMDSIQLCFQTQKSSLIHTVDVGAKSNGLAVAACRLASALVTFVIGHYPHLTKEFQIGWLYAAAVLLSLVTFAAGYAQHIYVVYGSFLIYGVISDAFICIATAHIALASPTLIRGWVLFSNQFLSILMASLVHFVFGTILSLDIRWVYYGLAIIAAALPVVLLPISHTSSQRL